MSIRKEEHGDVTKTKYVCFSYHTYNHFQPETIISSWDKLKTIKECLIDRLHFVGKQSMEVVIYDRAGNVKYSNI